MGRGSLRGRAGRQSLNFVRQESASCSEMVLPPAFGTSTKLSEGQTVPTGFRPKGRGEFEVTCHRKALR